MNDEACLVDGAEEICIPSAPCGIYFLVQGTEVLYVGQSQSILLRIGGHVAYCPRKFNRVLFIPVTADALDAEERKWIEHFDPPLNKTGTRSNGPESETRVRRVMERRGFGCVSEFSSLTKREALNTPGCGAVTLQRIQFMLRLRGMEFRDGR